MTKSNISILTCHHPMPMLGILAGLHEEFQRIGADMEGLMIEASILRNQAPIWQDDPRGLTCLHAW